MIRQHGFLQRGSTWADWSRRAYRVAISVTAAIFLESVAVSAEQPKPQPATRQAASASVTHQSLSDEQLRVLMPAIVQALNLASLDPVLAANFIPASWIESLVLGAVAVEAEVPTELEGKYVPRTWPIGPWAHSSSMVATISAVDPAAAAALYRALRPRIKAQCAQLGLTLPECERAIRKSMHRLSDPCVRAGAIGNIKTSMTPTQRELARLGEPVVVALHDQLQTLGKALFGTADQRQAGT